MPHALQPWASRPSCGIWMRTSCTSSEPAVIVCLNDVAHACTPAASAVSPPKERVHSGACSAAAASARDRLRGRRGCALRAHARHCDDARGRALSLLRTVARCCSADRSTKIFGAERFWLRLCSWRRGRTILRSCDTPPRDRCLRVRFSGQCSECTLTYQRVAAVTRAGGRGIGCIAAEGTRAERRLQR